MIANGRTQNDMSQEECQAWVQTGLALAPFCGHSCDASLDSAIIWSLVGEWTCRELFPPPQDVAGKRAWPRQGHPGKLCMPYNQRSVPLHTWARACFEQGSLPSLLALPGKAALLVLPGDKMFQSQYIENGKTRPAIAHGFGGAKTALPAGLMSLAMHGWRPLVAAMVGTANATPLWTEDDWKPILGTSIDVRMPPEFLTAREEQLLLSRWIKVPPKVLPIRHSTHTWLRLVQTAMTLLTPPMWTGSGSTLSSLATLIFC